MSTLFAGIDLGTSGCRIIVIDKAKTIHESASLMYPNPDNQTPSLWWNSVKELLKNLSLPIKQNLKSISVNGTSGSVLLVDSNGKPISQVLMYNDLRATEEAKLIKQTLPKDNGGQGASGSLARVLWLLKHDYKIKNVIPPKRGDIIELPILKNKMSSSLKNQGRWDNKIHISHQADYILGKLSNNYRLSDENNCLKLGYDVLNQRWPKELTNLGIDHSLLPKVHPAGITVATLNNQQAKKLGLPEDLQLVTGTTDSIAAFIATGADKVGEAVSSLGSTLVLKLISQKPIFSVEHGIYSHRLGDKWLVGGASNSGAKVLQHYFNQEQIDQMTLTLSPDQPTNLHYYPLIKNGERFPVADANKPAILTPRPDSDNIFFQGILEGIADIEALGYKKLVELGDQKLFSVRSVGGGSKNGAWIQIRKNTLRKNHLKVDMIQPKQTEAAYGSALLAMKGYLKND